MSYWTIDFGDKATMTVCDHPEAQYFCIVLEPKGRDTFSRDVTTEQLLAHALEHDILGGVSDSPWMSFAAGIEDKPKMVLLRSAGNRKRDFEAAAVIARYLIDDFNLTGEELEKMVSGTAQ